MEGKNGNEYGEKATRFLDLNTPAPRVPEGSRVALNFGSHCDTRLLLDTWLINRGLEVIFRRGS
jgi:hypothetical protein